MQRQREGQGSRVPWGSDLAQDDIPDGHILKAVVDHPIDTQLLWLLD